MKFTNYQKTLDRLHLSYIGAVSQSMKMRLSEENGVMTYCIYLAPSTMAQEATGDTTIPNVCPNSKFCRQFCLNSSGRNKGDIIAHGFYDSVINRSRIKKTVLFYHNKPLFMWLVIKEIKRAMNKANRLGMGFAVRLNGTSDISPEEFIDCETGKNLLELFPNVPFYDYTKVNSRYKLTKKYSNYYLVLSYTGHNQNTAKKWLENGENVAVVFANQTRIPKTFMGFPVCDGNKYDMRYLDPKGCVVALHYHRTANDYKTGKYVEPNTPFVIKDNDERVIW